MTLSLTDEQRKQYEEVGYFIVPALLNDAELQRFDARFREIVNDRAAAPVSMLVMRDVMVAKGAVRPASAEEAVAKIQDLQDDPVLFEGYVRHPALLAYIEAILGPDLKAVHTMLINKPPHVDGRHPLHQDLLYFPFRPADGIVAAWTAIDACTRENGCLVVLPGSHRGPLLEHMNPDWDFVNLAYFGVSESNTQKERMHLEMQPGDTVFFHPLLIHGSGKNRTSGFRRSISAHYASAHCRYVDGQQVVPKGARPYRLVRGQEQPGCI